MNVLPSSSAREGNRNENGTAYGKSAESLSGVSQSRCKRPGGAKDLAVE